MCCSFQVLQIYFQTSKSSKNQFKYFFFLRYRFCLIPILIILYNLLLFILLLSPNSYCHQNNIFIQAAILFFPKTHLLALKITTLFHCLLRGHSSSERSFQLSHVSLLGHLIRILRTKDMITILHSYYTEETKG